MLEQLSRVFVCVHRLGVTTGKKEGREACVLWCLRKKQGLGRQA